uniref:Uncharacterized protein n=1 Tax=Setaria italica TaxID=4555 RepID=A0A0Q3VTM6_SETIT
MKQAFGPAPWTLKIFFISLTTI